ncbi:MAG: LPS export ABC transporter periplasmic protein LptC [Caulobacteraceae bacterium]|nr:LPS export ABC transporter periplasmic protein LptC [Caulobacteraceae bacterium]
MASLAPALSAGPPPRGRARAHSRLVRILRWVLPMIMIGVIGVLAGLVGAHAVKRQAAARKDATTPIRMVNPHFFGRDNQGRAYTLGARQAARDEQSFQRVLLAYPSVTLDMDGAHPSTLTAESGVYHEDSRILFLKGHVRAADSKSTHFATDEATVNTRTGVVNGAGARISRTPVGQLNSRSFDVYDKGDRVIFKGGVHARLNPH